MSRWSVEMDLNVSLGLPCLGVRGPLFCLLPLWFHEQRYCPVQCHLAPVTAGGFGTSGTTWRPKVGGLAVVGHCVVVVWFKDV